MKKIVLTMVALMTMMTGFAETANHRVVKSAESYEMSFDMRRLATKLDLTSNQMEAIQVIQDKFSEEMSAAGTTNWGPMRARAVHQAVRKNAHQMHRVLNDKQFKTYMMLLGTTLHNQGL